MKKTVELCGLLAKQKEELDQYEAETALLLTCDIDDIETHVTARALLLAKISKLEQAIHTVCGAEQDGALCRAVKNKCDRAILSAELAAVFDAGEQVLLVAARIRTAEEKVAARIEAEKDTLVETIKEYNRSTDARVTKYYDITRLEAESGTLAFGYGKA